MWMMPPFLAFMGAWKVLSLVADAADIPAARSIGRACTLTLMIGGLLFPTPFRRATLEFMEQEARPVIERVQRSIEDLVPTPPTTTTQP